MAEFLDQTIRDLCGRSDAFRQMDQAEAVLKLVFDHLLPAYRQHHRDLLFHQSDESLFGPLFIGRACEAVLQQGGPWEDVQRIVAGASARLNDYLGHRPIAVLRTQQKMQPYAHEYVRPIPLFIRGGASPPARYHDLIELALAILEATDPMLLLEAMFDPAMLDELAVDPRAYDFDHPVNKRPNYIFGQWDMGKLDNSGRCRRFVLQQLGSGRDARPRHHGAVNCLRRRCVRGGGGAGGDDAHGLRRKRQAARHPRFQRHPGHSGATDCRLSRCASTNKLLAGLSGEHAKRLRAEAAALRQPFGGARQHFNQQLARRRARAIAAHNLAQFFARMGYIEAAARQVAWCRWRRPA